MTTLTETEESHVDAAFLALARLRDCAIREGRATSPINAAINALEVFCKENLK